jgi:hypothetical protein
MQESNASWQEAVLAAGILDPYWRVRWTIAGAGPFGIAISFGWVV